jgi:arginine-tRNA-protein transferase
MTHSDFPGRRLRYYLSVPNACPYLSGREEIKLFVHLPLKDAVSVHDQLAKLGFRRSQNIIYRPACMGCQACQSIRIPVKDFHISKSQAVTLKRNYDLKSSLSDAIATEDHYELLKSYLGARHADGGMMEMGPSDFQDMVEDSLVRTHLINYHQGEKLIASALIDVLDDGLSMSYSFYDPTMPQRSLGKFMILDHILKARKAGLDYVYLGYWVKNSPKMDYKARYRPHELLTDEGWVLKN